MFYGQCCLDGKGNRYAVTVIGFDAKESLSQMGVNGTEPRPVRNGMGEPWKILDSLSIKGLVISAVPTHQGCEYIAYGHTMWARNAAYEESGFGFLPVFVPIDKSGQYRLDETPEGTELPLFSVATENSKGETTYMTVDTPVKLGIGERVVFKPYRRGGKPASLTVKKIDGVYLATRIVVDDTSVQRISDMGYFQRDVPIRNTHQAWTDGLPWLIQVPDMSLVTANETFTARFQKLTSKTMLDYPELCILGTTMLPITSQESPVRNLGVNEQFGVDIRWSNIFYPQMFCPEFIPLDPKTLLYNNGLMQGLKDGDEFFLGGLSVDGKVVDVSAKGNITQYAEGKKYRFVDTPFEREKRIRVMYSGGILVAVEPILANFRYWDAVVEGFV